MPVFEGFKKRHSGTVKRAKGSSSQDLRIFICCFSDYTQDRVFNVIERFVPHEKKYPGPNKLAVPPEQGIWTSIIGCGLELAF